jgi:hypothetical protein
MMRKCRENYILLNSSWVFTFYLAGGSLGSARTSECISAIPAQTRNEFTARIHRAIVASNDRMRWRAVAGACCLSSHGAVLITRSCFPRYLSPHTSIGTCTLDKRDRTEVMSGLTKTSAWTGSVGPSSCLVDHPMLWWRQIELLRHACMVHTPCA